MRRVWRLIFVQSLSGTLPLAHSQRLLVFFSADLGLFQLHSPYPSHLNAGVVNCINIRHSLKYARTLAAPVLAQVGFSPSNYNTYPSRRNTQSTALSNRLINSIDTMGA
jgi:hypothetical protein